MKHSSTLRASLVVLAASLLFVSCKNRRSRVYVATETVPAYAEIEPNDDAFSANDFGVLYPGDLFYIDGFSTDDGSDPFDGFAFVSGGPIHVDFRLFIDDVRADLDVWLYDAQLDEVVGYFETPDNPETGGIDVDFGNLEFHLLVSSYERGSTYSLEIAVSELYLATAESPGAGLAPSLDAPAATNGTGLRIDGATEERPRAGEDRAPRSVRDYLRGEETSGLELRIRETYDAATDTIIELVHVQPRLREE